jgi:hypothetical protein
MTDTSLTSPSHTLRQLNTSNAVTLVNLSAVFEDLQTVLRCCERLVSALEHDDGPPDDLLIEALWTTALISYTRCFSSGDKDACLTEEDLTGTGLQGDVQDWHNVLLKLRAHYTSTTTNPRELFSIGVAQSPEGTASGVAITSARQPLVEDLSVRQTGAVALALSDMLNDRITAQQVKVFGEWKDTSKVELDRLPRLEVMITD